MLSLPAAIVVSAVLAAGVAAAGCGGDDDGSSGEGGGYGAPAPAETATETATATTGAGASSGKKVQVGMKDIAFAPKDVTAAPGQTVVWTNEEDVPHNVHADEGADFASGSFGRDGTFEYTIPDAAAGSEIAYECTIHPGMEGTIKVEG